MKTKGHIIAKVSLIIGFAMTFTILGVMFKEIPESIIIKQHEKSLSMPTTTFFDRVDRWFDLKPGELYYKIKPMSDRTIAAYSTLFSIILVLLIDLIIGVGRSRTREKLKK